MFWETRSHTHHKSFCGKYEDVKNEMKNKTKNEGVKNEGEYNILAQRDER